jgi:hypothetical protein
MLYNRYHSDVWLNKISIKRENQRWNYIVFVILLDYFDPVDRLEQEMHRIAVELYIEKWPEK